MTSHPTTTEPRTRAPPVTRRAHPEELRERPDGIKIGACFIAAIIAVSRCCRECARAFELRTHRRSRYDDARRGVPARLLRAARSGSSPTSRAPATSAEYREKIRPDRRRPRPARRRRHHLRRGDGQVTTPTSRAGSTCTVRCCTTSYRVLTVTGGHRSPTPWPSLAARHPRPHRRPPAHLLRVDRGQPPRPTCSRFLLFGVGEVATGHPRGRSGVPSPIVTGGHTSTPDDCGHWPACCTCGSRHPRRRVRSAWWAPAGTDARARLDRLEPLPESESDEVLWTTTAQEGEILLPRFAPALPEGQVIDLNRYRSERVSAGHPGSEEGAPGRIRTYAPASGARKKRSGAVAEYRRFRRSEPQFVDGSQRHIVVVFGCRVAPVRPEQPAGPARSPRADAPEQWP